MSRVAFISCRIRSDSVFYYSDTRGFYTPSFQRTMVKTVFFFTVRVKIILTAKFWLSLLNGYIPHRKGNYDVNETEKYFHGFYSGSFSRGNPHVSDIR